MKIMYKTNSIPAFFFALILLVLIVVSCSRKAPGYEASGYERMPSAKAAYSSAADAGGIAESEGKEFNATEEIYAGAQRKLVRRASLQIRALDLDAADKAVVVIMEKHGAYASSTNVSENSRHYTIRVPASSYDVLLSDVNGMGRLLYKNESAEDVTLHYYDLEGRLATKRELLKTYQSYLGKAKDIKEILSVEEKISELEDEIDGTGRELRNLANQVDYSTVNLEISGPVTASSYSAPTLLERLGELFGSFGEFVSTVLVILLGIVIYGVPIFLIIVLLFWILFGRIGLLKKLWRIVAGKK
jgi:hypothetical protein